MNGQPGAIFRDGDGRVVNTWTLDIVDGQIQAIRAVVNPDKLRHVGPVADAWAVVQETYAARRTTDWARGKDPRAQSRQASDSSQAWWSPA